MAFQSGRGRCRTLFYRKWVIANSFGFQFFLAQSFGNGQPIPRSSFQILVNRIQPHSASARDLPLS
jgi:hypothetical protein